MRQSVFIKANDGVLSDLTSLKKVKKMRETLMVGEIVDDIPSLHEENLSEELEAEGI